LSQNDVARLVTGAGGGYGDPVTRDPQLVWEDVRSGFITLDQARDIYRVVLDPATLAVDEDATRELRMESGE
jgi:N-methylhydantoinase B